MKMPLKVLVSVITLPTYWTNGALQVERDEAKCKGVNKVHHSQRRNVSPGSSLAQNFHQNWGFRPVPPTWNDVVDYLIGIGMWG